MLKLIGSSSEVCDHQIKIKKIKSNVSMWSTHHHVTVSDSMLLVMREPQDGRQWSSSSTCRAMLPRPGRPRCRLQPLRPPPAANARTPTHLARTHIKYAHEIWRKDEGKATAAFVQSDGTPTTAFFPGADAYKQTNEWATFETVI